MLLIALLVVAPQAFAQRQIKGVVVDEQNAPVVGVTVMVQGTMTGAITDGSGNYQINAKEGESLVFSFIGYQTETVKVAAATTINVTLKEDSQRLDEVIVVGYGTTTKRATTSAISTVKAEELVALPVTNMTQGLAGRSPGLIVQGSGGGINKTSTISIRGGNTPLVVIDGIVRAWSDFVALEPETIENLIILKDASATAVYGSRATNGILQVQTKRGDKGKTVVSYNFNQSWSQPSIWPNKLSSAEIAEYKNMALENDGAAAQYSEADIQMFKDGSDPYAHSNTDWRKLVLRNFAPQTKHSISINGGNDQHQYYASLSNIYQQSLYKTGSHWMDRTNYQLSETINLKKIGVKINANVDGYFQTQQHPYNSTSGGYYQVFSHVQNRSPMSIGVNKYGLPYNTCDNPVIETSNDAGYIKNQSKVFNGMMDVQWSLPWVKGLALSAKGNYRAYTTFGKNWRKDPVSYAWDSIEPISGSPSQLSESFTNGYSYTMQYFASYNKTFGKHTVSALGGYECTYGYYDTLGASRDSYEFNIDQINIGPVATATNSGSAAESARAGYIGQLKYNYDNRYFAEFSLRRDGSDNFPKDHRWGTFYSGSLGWIVSDEAFFASLKDNNIIDQLKLRASYGQVGIDNWSSPFEIGRYAYLSSYSQTSRSYVVDGVYATGFAEGALASQEITWFTTNQFDAGFDFSTLRDRLYGSFDYFYYETTGFIYSPSQADVGYTDPLGKSLPKVKTDSEHRRAGVEFQLGWRDAIGDFRYDVSANFTRFDQMWAKNASEGVSSLMNPYTRTSQQTGYYGNRYNCLGFYTNEQDVMNNVKRVSSSNITAGDLKYEDFNGDGKIDDSDQTRQGRSSFPRGNYGVNINLSWRGLNFRTLFQGATRFDMDIRGTGTAMQSAQSGTTPFYDYHTDFWTPTNTDAQFPRLLSSNGVNGDNNSASSTFWLINGAYLRMKDVSLSYDLKYKLLRNVGWVSNFNVGVSGQNLFTISKATKYGLDPENGSSEGYYYPNERTFALFVNIAF